MSKASNKKTAFIFDPTLQALQLHPMSSLHLVLLFSAPCFVVTNHKDQAMPIWGSRGPKETRNSKGSSSP